MKNREMLDQFGRLLISKVRDEVLECNDLIIQGKMGSKEDQELHELIKDFTPNQRETLRKFVRSNVDNTLHYFLWMIEQYEEYDLVFYSEGQEIPVSLRDNSDMLCGELGTKEGWIEKFSKYPPSIT